MKGESAELRGFESMLGSYFPVFASPEEASGKDHLGSVLLTIGAI